MEVKQNYLVENIINGGYDTSEFTNFLIGINGENATDINNYTLEDLKKVIFYYYFCYFSVLKHLLN